MISHKCELVNKIQRLDDSLSLVNNVTVVGILALERKKEGEGWQKTHSPRAVQMSDVEESERDMPLAGAAGRLSRPRRAHPPFARCPRMAHRRRQALGLPRLFGHRTHAVGQKSNRADFKIQSIKRLPERKKEREKMNHKEAERLRLTDLIFRHE